MERDWKALKKIVPNLRERYLKEKNIEIKKILEDKNKNDTERFWNAKKIIDKESKILVNCLDGHSRSKMIFHMTLMYRYGMLRDEDLDEFSDELKSYMNNIKEI